jgi:Tfp pilus assembly protein PilF
VSVINRMLADLEQRGAPAARAAGALHSPARSRRVRRDRNAIAMGVLLLPLAGVAVALWLPPGSIRLAPFAAPLARLAAPALDEGARARRTREAGVAAQPQPQTHPVTLAAAPPSDAVPVAAAPHAGAVAARAGHAQRAATASTPPAQVPAPRSERALATDGQRDAAAAAPAVGGAGTPVRRAQDGPAPANLTATPIGSSAAPAATPPTVSSNGRAEPAALSTPGFVKRASGSPMTHDAGARALRVPGAVHKEDRTTAAVRAQRRYAAARDLIARGEGHAARTPLREVLALDAGHHGARDLLVAVLRHSGEHGEARELLARGLELAPARAAFATPYARLLVDAGELDRAAQVLADASASGAGDAEFHALAAAIAQQRGQHDEAVAQYTRAIEARGGREGRLWLGLGISLAANGRDKDAHRAYRAALDSGDLPARLHDWARSRIE